MPEEVYRILLDDKDAIGGLGDFNRLFDVADAKAKALGGTLSNLSSSATQSINVLTGAISTTVRELASIETAKGPTDVVIRASERLTSKLIEERGAAALLNAELERMAAYGGRSGDVIGGQGKFDLASRLRGQTYYTGGTLEDRMAAYGNMPLSNDWLEKRLRGQMIIDDPAKGMGQQANRLTQYMNSAESGLRQYGTAAHEAGQKSGGAASGIEKLGHQIGRQFQHIVIGMLAFRAVDVVVTTINEIVEAQKAYSIETARFAAITEQSIGTAIQSYNRLEAAAAFRGVGPKESAPAIRLAAQFTPNESDQQRIVEYASRFNQAFGVDTGKAADILISGVRQLGGDMSQLDKLADTVAYTFSKMPGSIEDATGGIEDAIPLAEQWGTSWEVAFGALIQAATAANDSPAQLATSLGRVTEGLQELDRGGEKAFSRKDELLRRFGINVEDADKKLRPIPDLLEEIGQKLQALPAAQKGQLIELVAGGSVRPQQMIQLVAAFESFANGITTAGDKAVGAMDRFSDNLGSSFGSLNNVIAANIDIMRERVNALGMVSGELLRVLGFIGGQQSLQGAANYTTLMAGGYGAQAQTAAGAQLNRLSTQAKTPDELKRLVDEYNANARKQIDEQINKARTQFGPGFDLFGGQELIRQAESLFITDEMLKEAQRGMTGGVTDKSAKKRPTFPPAPPPTPEDRMLQSVRESIKGGEDPFKKAIDATDFTAQEIAQAKQMSAQWTQEELAAEMEILRTMGAKPEEVKAFSEAEKDALAILQEIVKTANGFEFISGDEAAKFQEALRKIKEENKERDKAAKDDFAFRRLKNVDPSQFGQLQALAGMYNQFLGNIGSPEKSQNINLLLGEQNVFKTLNVRMSALQMALEDLTKVEKAQLSGTWNLPTGAEAVVPISSLDIQRWNASGGGGMTPEQMMALLSQFGSALGAGAAAGGGSTEAGAGGGRATGFRTSPRGAFPSGMSREDELAADRAMHMEQLARRRRDVAPAPVTQGPSPADNLSMSDRLRDRAAGRAAVTTVNIQPMPLNANFTVNAMITLDGQRVAQTLFRRIFNEIIRLSRSGTGGSINRHQGAVR